MKPLYSVLLSLIFLAACTKDLTRFNNEEKRPSVVPAGGLFANAVKNISDGLASSSVNVNVFRHVVKQWGQAVIQEEAQYDFVTRSIPQAWWTRMYRDVLNDLNEAARNVGADAGLLPAVKENQLAIIDIMQVYTYNILVNSFGDIHYSEALRNDKLFPVYDDAKTVYADLLKRLAADISKLNPASGSFATTEDFLYQGNVNQWIAFANALYMKMGMTIADVDNATARSIVEASDAKAISSPAANAVFKYLATPPNNNPLYDQLVLAGRTDYIAAKDLMDVLNGMADPRKPQFFGTNNVGMYVGAVVGQASSFAGTSKPSAKVAAPDAPNLLADYVETEFFRAEAKERGYNVAGTAEQHYNNAIRASITWWGGTNTEADVYLARPDVAYQTAAGNWKQKIGFQKWIALYNRPFDGWTEMRRLDAPILPPPVGARSGFPNRLTYPANEQQLNGTNYTNAAKAIGGDKVETKLFWDIF
ncbi:SusD/RagB family nutrient-binding outer membrane lipoprotein [Segetibacter sp. 3557_3]|uniref:SusD/RagB family nutrient-binding outer membrane lipoprotein n=1 Tax=Segetibacter sp. 3557_3 TaxID=2547429 RepID=UPI001058D5F1|nr:SusD/RagB family nutrient-binding outer membrane lipoprotein [Segetibacter sp. 3557_3]TDH28941.1 SusD/RagB family nutrient-binding outer membrane lipoprotein [Segetibacter sp. 3557_3]